MHLGFQSWLTHMKGDENIDFECENDFKSTHILNLIPDQFLM